MAKTLARQYVFTPGAANAGTIVVPGRIALEQLLVITNTTKNVIIYNFADATYAGTVATFTSGNTASFPNLDQRADGYTTITLAYNTSSHSANDKIQVLYEETQNGVTIRPWSFGTDAIERMRVSTPQSMIDADFEYGLQPTKWAGYGLMRGYPSIYELREAGRPVLKGISARQRRPEVALEIRNASPIHEGCLSRALCLAQRRKYLDGRLSNQGVP